MFEKDFNGYNYSNCRPAKALYGLACCAFIGLNKICSRNFLGHAAYFLASFLASHSSTAEYI